MVKKQKDSEEMIVFREGRGIKHEKGNYLYRYTRLR